MKIVILLLIVLLAGLQIRLWSGPGSYAEVSRLNSEISQQTQDNDVLTSRNDYLYNEVNELKSGFDAIEEIARNDLVLIRKGETFYLIVDK